MTDIKSKEARSKNMSAIRSRDTKPEMFIRKRLFAKGYRYRIASKLIPGHPDLYLAKYNAAVFIHGCFWHRHADCKYAYMPKSKVDFWNTKFANNRKRDKIVKEELADRGIKMIVVWECVIKQAQKKGNDPELLIATIEKYIKSGPQYIEIDADLLL